MDGFLVRIITSNTSLRLAAELHYLFYDSFSESFYLSKASPRSAFCIPRLLVDSDMLILALSLLAYLDPYCFFCFGGRAFLVINVLIFTEFSSWTLGRSNSDNVSSCRSFSSFLMSLTIFQCCSWSAEAYTTSLNFCRAYVTYAGTSTIRKWVSCRQNSMA